LSDVLATQHSPEGTGRFWFWRGRTAAAERAVKARTAVVREKYILMDVVVDVIRKEIYIGGRRLRESDRRIEGEGDG
jgi:hypothetical protein